MRAPQTGRWMRRKAQTEGCIAALSYRYPSKPGRPLPRIRRGRCLHRPGTPCDAANPRRRAKSPALHCGHKQVPARQRQPSARPDGGPMKSSAPTLGCGGRSARETTRRRDTACRPRFRHSFALHCRAGVHARRGGLRRPGRVLAGLGAAPLSRPTPTAPLTGEPFRRQSPKSLPCKGRWMRRKAQTEGCIAALSYRYPSKPGRPLPRIRRGRCLHRPGSPAMPQTPCGGRNRPPYIAAGSGRQQIRARHPPGPPAGR